jgi:hypothetical protein
MSYCCLPDLWGTQDARKPAHALTIEMIVKVRLLLYQKSKIIMYGFNSLERICGGLMTGHGYESLPDVPQQMP